MTDRVVVTGVQVNGVDFSFREEHVWNEELLEVVRKAFTAQITGTFQMTTAQIDDVVGIFRGGFTSDDLRKEGPGFGVEMPGMDLEDDDGEWMTPPDVVR